MKVQQFIPPIRPCFPMDFYDTRHTLSEKATANLHALASKSVTLREVNMTHDWIGGS